MNFPNGGKPVGLTRIAILQEKTQETLSADQEWIPCPKISYRPISLLPFILSCYRLGSLELANITRFGNIFVIFLQFPQHRHLFRRYIMDVDRSFPQKTSRRERV